MARTVLKWQGGLMEFDAVELEAPAYELAVTEYPIEMGASLIDHIRQKPITLRMRVFVSNSPARGNGLTHLDGFTPNTSLELQVRQPLLNAPPAAQLPTSVAGVALVQTVPVRAVVRTWDPQREKLRRVESVYAELKLAMAQARELTIATDTLGDFDRMLLRTLRTERDGKSGSALRFDLEFQQMLFAELVARDVSALLPKPKEPRSKKKKDEGKKTPAAADKQTESASTLWGLTAP